MNVRTLAAALACGFLLGGLAAPAPIRPPTAPVDHPALDPPPALLEAGGPAWGDCTLLEAALPAAGWPAFLVPTMLAVARAESGCSPDAEHATFRERSVGPLQINLRAHPWVSEWCARDHFCAARAALRIYRRQGLRAWTAWRTGAFRPYLDGAR